MNCLYKILPALFGGLLFLCPLVLNAQAPTYNLSWYKTSCSTSAGTPTEVRVDITPFSSGTTYVCELYANPNPLGSQSNNPILGSVLETYITATNDAIIDGFFTTTLYKTSYYIKVYSAGNPSQSTLQYIDVQRLVPSAGSYTNNISYSVSTNPLFCNPSASNMEVVLSLSGGIGPYYYLWTSSTATIGNPTSQSPTLPIYISGNSGPKHQYKVEISDAAGCGRVIDNIEYTPNQPIGNLSIDIKPFQFNFQECTDVVVEILNAPTYGTYIYRWYNSAGNQFGSGLHSPFRYYLEPSSNYYVEVRTTNDCLIETLPFQTPAAIDCTIGSITGDPCIGGSASQITIEAFFGTAPYRYEIAGVSPNTCSTTLDNASNSVTIGSMTCNGTITPNIPVGAYEVTVIDYYGCEFMKQIQVGQNVNDLILEITTEDEVCGGADGSFRIEANNFTGSLNFEVVDWPGKPTVGLLGTFQSNNSSYERIGLPAGTYTVEISLDGGVNNYCTRTEVITINNDGIALIGTQVSSAQGSANMGTILLNVTGAPLGDIDFQWTSQTTNNPYGLTEFGGSGDEGYNELSELGADTYTVTITYEGCTLTQTFVVPFCALVASENSTGDRCKLSAGQAYVLVTDNGIDVTNQASYQWEQILPSQQPIGTTNYVINDIEEGTYSVTVTYGGCSVVEQIAVGALPMPTVANVKEAYCGGNNGEADFYLHQLAWRLSSSSLVWTDDNNQPLPSGATVTYNQFGTGMNLQTTAKNLPVGKYIIHVDVTGAGGTCSYQVIVNIKASNTTPSYTITTSSALCGTNGIVSVQGLSYPFGSTSTVPTYTWTPLSPLPTGLYVGETINGIESGDYQLDATYSYYSACNHTQQVNLSSINPILTVDYIQNEGCGGAGEFRVSTNLETTHHTYDYTVTDDNTSLVVAQSSNGLFSNMAPGKYTVTLNTNNPSCPPTTASITIERSELVVINQLNATCGTGGVLEVDLHDINGQALPATNSDFVWSNGIQNRINNNLTQGAYTITITQSNGLPCIATFLVVNNPLIITNEVIEHSCTGSNGSINLTTNDVGSVSYVWSNGSSASNISGLSPGEYEVTITGSSNGDGTCVLYKSYTIYEGFTLATSAEDVLCNGDNDGKVQALVSNSNAPITSYVWSNGAYSPSQNNVSGGAYTVTVTDANTCTMTSSVTVNEPNALTITSFQPYSGSDPLITCGGEVQVNGGTGPYVVAWQLLQVEQQDDGSGNLIDVIIGGIEVAHTQAAQAGVIYTENKLDPGVYAIIVTDENDCQISSTITIEIVPQNTVLPTMYFRWEKQLDNGGTGTIANDTPDDTEIKAKVIADNMETQIKDVVDQFSDALNENTCDKVDDIVDETKLSYDLKYHHYTLYYYNRRGELTRTVPPAGVDFLDGTEIAAHKEFRTNQTQTLPSKELPNHTLVTTYHYDAAGRSIESVSPDAGLVQQAFRSDGLVRFSQDARQKGFATERMTYIKYDGLNRVIEQGEMDVPNGSTYAAYITGQGQTDINTLDFPLDIPAINKTEWVRTHYSDKHIISNSPTVNISYHGLGIQEQRYLRNRVSYTEAWNGGSNINAITTTTYSYDPHGNVEWIRNYIPGLGDNYIRLEYDLISRNVNKVCYNEFAIDRFYHRYEYDEQNRIVNTETSRDNIVWDSDARYSYYEHGPLKRKEIGDDKIQGMDYTYTIHGWLKTINHPYLNKYENANSNTTNNQLNDPGQDGYTSSGNNEVQKDVWGFSLGYYQGDYARQSINGTGGYNSVNDAINYNSQELYNGNITYWSNGTTENTLTLGDQEKLTQRSFNYDNLNRILGSELSIVNLGNTPAFGTVNNQFRTAYTYDANGNIKTLQRYDGSSAGQLIDDISYQYNVNGAGKLENNQLATIQDAVGTTANLGDIDNQNYVYDARGSIIQIVEPNNSNRTTDITWLNTGKVKTVSIKESGRGGTMVEKSRLEYLYDATGNRVAKIWKEVVSSPVTWKHTYYVCDASGNKMSIYGRGYEQRLTITNPYRTYYEVKEQLLYGSDRIGSINKNTRLFTNNYTDLSTAESYAGWDINTKLNTTSTSSFDFGTRVLGAKEYDLVDHLGNVTTQISDRKAGTLATNDIQADVLSYQQYYPFGWNMPGRSKNSDKSRFTFNGKEFDPEWNIQDYGFRLYDNRLGKFLSFDPLAPKYPKFSPYHYASNSPIGAIDQDGLEGKTVIYWLDMEGGMGALYGDATLVNVTVKSIDIDKYIAYTRVLLGNARTGELMSSEALGYINESSLSNHEGLAPSSLYDYTDPDDMAWKEEMDAEYLANGGNWAAISARDQLAPENRWKNIEDATTAVQAGTPGLVVITGRIKGKIKTSGDTDGTVRHKYYNTDGKLVTITDARGRVPDYTNPGHHDITSPEFRGGGSKKTELLPSNHEKLWEKAIPDKSGPLTNRGVAKNWYAKSKDGSIHRFQNDHNDEVHWSGSTGGASGLPVPKRIKEKLNK